MCRTGLIKVVDGRTTLRFRALAYIVFILNFNLFFIRNIMSVHPEYDTTRFLLQNISRQTFTILPLDLCPCCTQRKLQLHSDVSRSVKAKYI